MLSPVVLWCQPKRRHRGGPASCWEKSAGWLPREVFWVRELKSAKHDVFEIFVWLHLKFFVKNFPAQLDFLPVFGTNRVLSGSQSDPPPSLSPAPFVCWLDRDLGGGGNLAGRLWLEKECWLDGEKFLPQAVQTLNRLIHA